MNKLFAAAKNAAFSALPASVAPENQYAKSYAASLTLLVSADFSFDVGEFQQAAMFLEKDPVLTETGMVVRAVEFFRAYTNALKDVMCANNIDFPTIQTEMIAEVREVPAEYKAALRSMLNTLGSVCGPDEKAIIYRINL